VDVLFGGNKNETERKVIKFSGVKKLMLKAKRFRKTKKFVNNKVMSKFVVKECV
jgi:hypothetical protein